MPLAAPIAKPQSWGISREQLNSEWRPFWDKLVRAYPFWNFGSMNINDVKSGADGTANTNVWVNGSYGPALDFAGTTSHVQTPGFAPPTRGMVIFLAKFDSGNGASPVHGTLDFESRVSGGNKLLHQFFNRTLTGTNYDVPYGNYTLAGLGWDASSGAGPLYKDGALLQTKTGHTVNPGTITNMYIGSAGTNRFLDGLMEMVLVLNDWPTQAEWDMLAADPFGWSRQAVTVPSGNTYTGSLQASGSSTLSLDGSRFKTSELESTGTSTVELVGSRHVGSELFVEGVSGATLLGSRVLSGEMTSDASSSLLLNGARLLSGEVVVNGSSVLTWIDSGYVNGVLLVEGNSALYLEGSKIVSSGGLLPTGEGSLILNSEITIGGNLYLSGGSRLLLLNAASARKTSLAGNSSFTMSGDVLPKTLHLSVNGTSDLYMSGSIDRTGKLVSVGLSDMELDSSVDMYGSFLL